MYIIVVGGGKVGYYLAKELVTEGHEVLVVEKDRSKCERIAEEMGSIAMQGDGCEATTLEDAGAARADIAIAVTGDDEDNLVVCQVAKSKFGVPRTIARINNPKNESIFKKLGIDITVSSTNLILEHIEQELPSHPLLHLLNLRGLGLELVEVKVSPHSSVIGKSLKNVNLPPECVLCLVVNSHKGAILPTGDTYLEAEDEVVAVTKPEAEVILRSILGGG
ncbi:MAG: TrkA family potassium uptake protein [Chloroflexi bacterium]|nr:TrkA family potassium uptake protein [Chloroflexota bacterium]